MRTEKNKCKHAPSLNADRMLNSSTILNHFLAEAGPPAALMTGQLVENDPITSDIAPQIFARLQCVVHLTQRMDDDINRTRSRTVPPDAIFRCIPVVSDVGEIIVINVHNRVEIGLLDVRRLVDSAAMRIRAEQDDLEDLAVSM